MGRRPLEDIFSKAAREADKEVARMEAMRNGFRAVRGWFNELRDGQGNRTGKDFLVALDGLDCDVTLEYNMACNAAYSPFDYSLNLPGQSSFINIMKYSILSLKDVAGTFHSMCHEAMHALQWNKTPALHASPYNAQAEIILSPLDFVMMTERTEQDAYVKQAWLARFAAKDHPEAAESSDKEAISVAELDVICRSAADEAEALAVAARFAMKKLHDKDNPDFSFADYYHRQALLQYKVKVQARLAEGGRKFPLAVRLADEDIVAIGNSFGPNIFFNRPEFLRRPVLSPDNQRLLDEINKLMGIYRENDLPVMDQNMRDSLMKAAQADQVTPDASAPGPV